MYETVADGTLTSYYVNDLTRSPESGQRYEHIWARRGVAPARTSHDPAARKKGPRSTTTLMARTLTEWESVRTRS